MTKYWETIIGLEIHAQLNTTSKLFSRSATRFNKEVNTQVSFFDAAMPGTLPVINKQAIMLALKASILLNGKINKISHFDRKNYFYPDSPQGYQISQFFYPIMTNGYLSINSIEGSPLLVKINRIHIEQDAGRSIYQSNNPNTYIDLNRAGIPLIEIVTDPNFRNPADVVTFLKNLRQLLKFCGICNGNLENGSLRCDANISIRKKTDHNYGTRVEIKNLNSFKNIYNAISSESRRQIALLKNNKTILQETRAYDLSNNRTKTLRNKENLQDYRYFPDPDLLPLKISDTLINKVKLSIPELPAQKRARYIQDMDLPDHYADIIVSEKEIADFFDQVVTKISPKLAAVWLICELFGRLNKKKISFTNIPISTQNFISLLESIEKKSISQKMAKTALDEMVFFHKDIDVILKKHKFVQISNRSVIAKSIEKILQQHEAKIQQYKNGKTKLFGFLIGQIMKASQGHLNPTIVKEILQTKLDNYALS